MQATDYFSYRKLLPLFNVQFLSLFSFSVLRDAILVLIVFSQIDLWGIKNGVLVNLVMACSILPMLLFSSYAGKLADSKDKVWLIQRIKFLELAFAIIAGLALYCDWDGILIAALFGFGILSAALGPTKYAMLPQYFSVRNLGMAIGYIEFGSFLAILTGQSFGSWAMASHWQATLIFVMVISAVSGIYFSFRLYPAPATTTHQQHFYINPFQDAREMYSSVTAYPKLMRINLHAIAWFWALGLINTTEFALFTKNFLGGDGHLFSVVLALFSLGLGIGTWLCAKFSKGRIIHRFVLLGGACASLIMLLILVSHHSIITIYQTPVKFLQSPGGIITLMAITFYSVCIGFYSLTCYTEIQIISNPEYRAQVIASSNILSSIYLLLAAVSCALLQVVISSWWIIMLAITVNILIVMRYYFKVRQVINV